MEHIEELIIAVEKQRKVLCAKWITVLLYTINKYPVKFNKLRQVLPTISAKMLSKTLAKMQINGLITKDDDLYSITKNGNKILIVNLEYVTKLETIEI